ncbi:YbaK/EbsC family protein [Streptomyces sp. NPDC006285]|uniref:YbaK/EbsC family protein n=1 Tax=Streptomyces sp. NPDC006285 TaxID=3364742 RepID=UPI0036A76788
MTLGKSARKFQEELDRRGLDATVIELASSTRTADDAANSLGCAPAQIVKSLVFRATTTGEAVIVLASGPNRVNEKTLAAHVGSEIGKADADFVKTTTGYSIGGVPPLGHKNEAVLFVDQDLLGFPEVWAAAGTPHAVFKISGAITEILPKHTVVDVT